ncbi:hypothetical protein AB4Y44_05505 [Paraburkholderia sp. BR10937]|uniref:hypothetical protein n=1 Tax=Paraburkholderia sp. BR10937 TaxID=3236994 RepID=UPI0034D1D0CE
MAIETNGSAPKPGSFSLSWSGGLEYGSRQMSFDGEGRFYFATGDTVNEDSQTGIGTFMLNVQSVDLQELKAVAQALCDKDIQTGGPETYDPPATFRVTCLEDGKVVNRSGSIRTIPERFNREIFDTPFRLSERAWVEGRKLIKLDFSTCKVEHGKDGYIVSVCFVNSGNGWIKFKTPDQWGGTSIDGRLGSGAIAKFNKNGMRDEAKQSWGFALGGQKLINRDEFQDGVVLLSPGDSKVLTFQTKPDYRASKGEFEFSGIAFMRIAFEGDGWGLSSQVDFRAVKTRITFDRDYPATPQEREQWEAKHREDMSWQPVKPGETFAEDGLYRAVQKSGGMPIHSLQLRPFKSGDVAPTESVKMFTESASGAELNKPVQWLWAGSAPTPVKPWSPDLIAGTEHSCDPGAACPRSGRWLARTATRDWQYSYDLARIVTRTRGERMPVDEGTTWEWLGL